MKRKRLIIFLILASVCFAGYCGTWLYYYNCIWMPHVELAAGSLKKTKFDDARVTIYSLKDNLGDTYSIQIPWFGKFECCIMTAPTIVFNDAKPIVDENGNTTYESYIKNNSGFDINLSGEFNMKGSIETYKFSIAPFPKEKADEKKYAQDVFVVVSSEGNLLNEAELSQKELALYQDASSEIKRLMNNAKAIFNISNT